MWWRVTRNRLLRSGQSSSQSVSAIRRLRTNSDYYATNDRLHILHIFPPEKGGVNYLDRYVKEGQPDFFGRRMQKTARSSTGDYYRLRRYAISASKQ